MDGLETSTAPNGSLVSVLRHDRMIAAGGLGGVVALAWLYLRHSAMVMNHAAMGMAPEAYAADAGALVLTFVMWTVMMAGMMLPSASPAILLYGAVVRRNGAIGRVLPGVWIFACGYLLVWTVFSVLATLLQAALDHAALLTPAMATPDPALAGAVLIGAGVYQATPLKRVCLSKCRDPMTLFVARWRPGAGGALRMGLEHGAYCVGCCWALMLLLFVAGVMSLLWVALIAAFVFVEKVLAPGFTLSLTTGVLLFGAGFYVLLQG